MSLYLSVSIGDISCLTGQVGLERSSCIFAFNVCQHSRGGELTMPEFVYAADRFGRI